MVLRLNLHSVQRVGQEDLSKTLRRSFEKRSPPCLPTCPYCREPWGHWVLGMLLSLASAYKPTGGSVPIIASLGISPSGQYTVTYPLLTLWVVLQISSAHSLFVFMGFRGKNHLLSLHFFSEEMKKKLENIHIFKLLSLTSKYEEYENVLFSLRFVLQNQEILDYRFIWFRWH